MIIGHELKLGMMTIFWLMTTLIWLHLFVLLVLSHILVSLNPKIFCVVVIIILFNEAWIIDSDFNWTIKETNLELIVTFWYRNLGYREINIGWSLAY